MPIDPEAFKECDNVEYSVDVKLCATIYIKAKTREEAIEKFTTWIGSDKPDAMNGIYLSDNRDIVLDDDVVLSPGMTCYGVWGN